MQYTFEVIWRQQAPDRWVAVLKDPQTDSEREIHSLREFEQALQALVAGGAEVSAPGSAPAAPEAAADD